MLEYLEKPKPTLTQTPVFIIGTQLMTHHMDTQERASSWWRYFVFQTKSLYVSLAGLDSLCTPHWRQNHWSGHFCLLNAGINSIYHYAQIFYLLTSSVFSVATVRNYYKPGTLKHSGSYEEKKITTTGPTLRFSSSTFSQRLQWKICSLLLRATRGC